MTPEDERAEAVLRVAEDRTLSREAKLAAIAHHLAQMRTAPVGRKSRKARSAA